MGEPTSAKQAAVDAFYHEHGPCCAGCDWWRWINVLAGECLQSKIVPGRDRGAMLHLTGASLAVGAGHALTPRDHHCGKFKDTYDWPSHVRRGMRP